jgi:hypothetical protein
VTQASRPLPFLNKKIAIWVLIVFGLIVLGAANTHLVYMAVATQPDCVTHLKSGEAKVTPSSFSAAKSVCSQR